MTRVSKHPDLQVIPSRPRRSYAILEAADLAKPLEDPEVTCGGSETSHHGLLTLRPLSPMQIKGIEPPPDFNIDRDNLR